MFVKRGVSQALKPKAVSSGVVCVKLEHRLSRDTSPDQNIHYCSNGWNIDVQLLFIKSNSSIVTAEKMLSSCSFFPLYTRAWSYWFHIQIFVIIKTQHTQMYPACAQSPCTPASALLLVLVPLLFVLWTEYLCERKRKDHSFKMKIEKTPVCFHCHCLAELRLANKGRSCCVRYWWKKLEGGGADGRIVIIYQLLVVSLTNPGTCRKDAHKAWRTGTKGKHIPAQQPETSRYVITGVKADVEECLWRSRLHY